MGGKCGWLKVLALYRSAGFLSAGILLLYGRHHAGLGEGEKLSVARSVDAGNNSQSSP